VSSEQQPTQTALADALGLARSRITALKKEGMPTHSIDAAHAWRKVRQNIARRKPLPRSSAQRLPPATLARPARAGPCLAVSDVEALADLADAALKRDNLDMAEKTVRQLRGLLKNLPVDASPHLTLRVWVELVIYLLHDAAEIRHAADVGALLSPAEFGARLGLDGWPASVVLFEACDFDNISINGYPEFSDDEDKEILR